MKMPKSKARLRASEAKVGVLYKFSFSTRAY